MATLRIIDTDYTGDRTFNEYPFPLSNFQKNAIDSYLNGDNVFIAAPTGSGKTLPAEHALKHAIANGKKAIYTSPIKTLSNQKFKEFTDKFPEADVGILTGDIKYNPTGNILIMTTEILRNLLFNKKIQDIQNRIEIELDIYKDFSLVVFDEIHYINDSDRGKVWEECIILLPNHIQLMMLSATIDNPQEFCEWIRTIKQKNIVLSSTYKRIVPLRHSIYTNYLESFMRKTKDFKNCDKYNNELCIFSDEIESFNAEKYQEVTHHLKRTHQGLSRSHVYQELIKYLTTHSLTPCIFFCFSRKKCEQQATAVAHSLLEQEEISEMKRIVGFYLRKCDQYDSYVKMSQYATLMKCLEKGIAYHHSGLLPIFKEIVEILYGKHLVKVLFATETFAVGVNMPTKTVVFTSLEKFSGNDFRTLYTHEYLQMGGRAGRRGIDKEGLVILLPNLQALPNTHTMNNLINGNSQIIQSKFTADYKLVLKIMLNNTSVDNIVHNSLLHTEITNQSECLKKELNSIQIPETDFSLCEEYDQLIAAPTNGFIKIPQSQMKKNRKRASKIKYSEGFEDLYKLYNSHKGAIERKKTIEYELTNSGNYIQNDITKVVEILVKYGYISNTDEFTSDAVTMKGRVASEINECNEILLAELVYNGHLDDITYKDLGAVLSLFSDSKPTNTNQEDQKTDAHCPYKYIKYVDVIKQTCKDWSEIESLKRVYINSEWDYNTYLMEATYRWLDGESFEGLSGEYDLYEGNLIKDFIRIYNLSAEVESIGEMLGKQNLRVEAAKVREHIVRDIVNIESLYIKNI